MRIDHEKAGETTAGIGARGASKAPASRVVARALGLALFVAVVWFALAQWGYEHINCEF